MNEPLDLGPIAACRALLHEWSTNRPRGSADSLYFRSKMALQLRAALGPCCDSHNAHCEPPNELCCQYCTEACHGMHAHDGMLALSHHDGAACVLDGRS